MPYILLYLQALTCWALQWAQMDRLLARIWISEHTLETVIALFLISFLVAILGCLPTRENQEG